MKPIILSVFVVFMIYFTSTTSVLGMYSNLTDKYGDNLSSLTPKLSFVDEDAQLAKKNDKLEVLF